QLEQLQKIQRKRICLWERYFSRLKMLKERGLINLPDLPEYAKNNGHMFFIICRNKSERSDLIKYLRQESILAVFHYQSLHKSPFYGRKHDGRDLPNADRYSDRLLRLPLYFELTEREQDIVIDSVFDFYLGK
ncbi:MAG: DegT/DnrJ/EryC1/StrS family aminotransferase, partial [Candidatus Aminicenantales bacterium]